jgi:hypothetical protein
LNVFFLQLNSQSLLAAALVVVLGLDLAAAWEKVVAVRDPCFFVVAVEFIILTLFVAASMCSSFAHLVLQVF